MYQIIVLLGIIAFISVFLIRKSKRLNRKSLNRKSLSRLSRLSVSKPLRDSNNPLTCYYIMNSKGDHMYSYMSSSGPIVQLGPNPGYTSEWTTKWYWNTNEWSLFTMSDGGGASGFLVTTDADYYNTTIWNPAAYYAGSDKVNPWAMGWVINGVDPTQDVNYNCDIQYNYGGRSYWLSSNPVNGLVVMQDTPDSSFIVYNSCAVDLKQACRDRSSDEASRCDNECEDEEEQGFCGLACAAADTTRKALCDSQSWISQCSAGDDGCIPPPSLI